MSRMHEIRPWGLLDLQLWPFWASLDIFFSFNFKVPSNSGLLSLTLIRMFFERISFHKVVWQACCSLDKLNFCNTLCFIHCNRNRHQNVLMIKIYFKFCRRSINQPITVFTKSSYRNVSASQVHQWWCDAKMSITIINLWLSGPYVWSKGANFKCRAEEQHPFRLIHMGFDLTVCCSSRP